MQDFQQRVVDEKKELDEKTEKLAAFIKGDLFTTLGEHEQGRLGKQYGLMVAYSAVLGERINAF